MNISIIIATRNRAGLLEACLNKLVPQCNLHDEIIVVDSSNTNQTACIIKPFVNKYPVRYLYEPGKGASFARNVGFKLATKTGVAFIDDDSLVTPGWLQGIRSTLISRGKKFRRCVYQGAVTQQYQHHGIYERLRLRDFQNDLVKIGMQSTTKWYTPLQYIMACNVFSYRSVFKLIPDLFNNKLFPFVGEELDLACRFIQMGIPIVYAPHIRVIHTKPNAVTLMASIIRAYQYGRAVALCRKIYFSDPNFLFHYYAHPLEKRPSVPASSSSKNITSTNLWQSIQTHTFYTTTTYSYIFGYSLYTTLPLSMLIR
jgi:glycosyltransferase involved in cell wall biosynthesis